MGLGTIGGVVGDIEAQGSMDQAQQAQQAALQGILNINTPTIAEEQVSPTNEAVAGTLNPNMQSTAQIGSNAMAGISTDPRLQQAQMQALSQLQQQGQSGFTSAQLAALQSANQQAAGQAQSANAATMQNMAARGMGGSGMELAARLSNSQNAANMANQQGNQLAGQAQQNALAATAASGQLGGQMQQTQFGQQSQVAAAQNAINQFNTANQQNVIGQNTTAQNAAQAANLANAQNVANTNTGIANQAQYYNKGLYQQQYQDQLGQAAAAAGQYNNNSNFYQNQAAQTQGMYAGIGSGIQSGITSAMTGMPSGGGSSMSAGYGAPSSATASNNFGAAPLQSGANSASSSNPFNLYKGGLIDEEMANRQVKAKNFANGGLADPEIGYADGGDVRSNLAAMQRGANATSDAIARANGQGTGTSFDPTKYGRPDYTNAEDAAQNGQDEAAASDAGKAYAKYRADNGLDASGYAMGGRVNPHPQSAPSDNYGQMGMFHGGKVNVNNDTTDDTDPTWAFIKQCLAQPQSPGYADGGQVSHVPPTDKEIEDAFTPSTQYEKGYKPPQLPTLQAPKNNAPSGDVNSPNYDPTMDTAINHQKGYDDGGEVTPSPSPMPTMVPAQGSGMQRTSDNDLDAMSPEELDVQMKKLKYVMAKKKMANGGQVESADTSQKTLGATIGYPGSQPSPQPSTQPKSYKEGGKVPGKANVPGDSPKNDTVHAKLSPGEIVLPRSILASGDEAIMDFVKHVMKKGESK